MNSVRTISPTIARRLAITRQRLAGPRPSNSGARPDASSILQVVRDLGYLQLDPISAVARSHLLVLWSRLGKYDRADLDKLLWQERQLFEYWAHGASIVLTEDYPIHYAHMRVYPQGDTKFARDVRDWMEQNRALKRVILKELSHKGPLPSRYFEEMGVPSEEWVSTGWTGGRNISRMLDFLWMQGKIMVAGRAGLQKLWDLSERCLPDWTPREKLSKREWPRRALRGLGIGTRRQIEQHLARWRYPNSPKMLDELLDSNAIEPVQIVQDGRAWKGDWYLDTDALPLLERLEAGEWEPRTTLLSPFDSLICDRARTLQLFNFQYTIEIYVPQAKRQYGYYVLPVLHGDRLIGRIDPAMDRERGRLTIKSAHFEPDAPKTRTTARAVERTIEELAAFLGAKDIHYERQVARALRFNQGK